MISFNGKWKHTSDSTAGISWQTYWKIVVLNDSSYEHMIELYKEGEDDWILIMEEGRMKQLFHNMFGYNIRKEFSCSEDGMDYIDDFLYRLEKLKAFL